MLITASQVMPDGPRPTAGKWIWGARGAYAGASGAAVVGRTVAVGAGVGDSSGGGGPPLPGNDRQSGECGSPAAAGTSLFTNSGAATNAAAPSVPAAGSCAQVSTTAASPSALRTHQPWASNTSCSQKLALIMPLPRKPGLM